MKSFLLFLTAFFTSNFKERRDLALENLALRQQLAVLKRERKRPAIKNRDRLFWVWLSRIWRGWRESLIIVKPETVIGWHRQVFRLFWTKLSRRKIGGRPAVDPKVRALIKQMTEANPLWGAPRIHGELQKLGIEIAASSLMKLLKIQAGRSFGEAQQVFQGGMRFSVGTRLLELFPRSAEMNASAVQSEIQRFAASLLPWSHNVPPCDTLCDKSHIVSPFERVGFGQSSPQ